MRKEEILIKSFKGEIVVLVQRNIDHLQVNYLMERLGTTEWLAPSTPSTLRLVGREP